VPRSILKSDPKDFESRKRNPISLGNDSNIDNDLKILKIGEVSTGIELSKDIVLFRKPVTSSKITTDELFISVIKGNRVPSTTAPQFIFQNPEPDEIDYGINFNIFAGGSTFMNVTGDDATFFLDSDAAQIYTIGDDVNNSFLYRYGSTGEALVSLMELKQAGELRLYSTANVSDYFSIAIAAEGATTLSTTDADTTVGHLTLDVDGDIELNADGGQVWIKDATAVSASIVDIVVAPSAATCIVQ